MIAYDDLAAVVFICCLIFYLVYRGTRVEAPPKVDPRMQSGFKAGQAEEASSTRVFSMKELSQYTGAGPLKRIYIGSMGKVYDVTDSGFYEPGSTYGKAFAGRDASIDLATMEIESQHAVTEDSVANLTPPELKVLQDWDSKFKSKYTLMGVIEASPFAAEDKKSTNSSKED
jgi:predicted heme/steroid binding protein